jgi:predicted PurR-regulated permease PerM
LFFERKETLAMSTDQPQPSLPDDRLETLKRLKAEKFSRYFLLVVLIGIGIVFFNMIKIFLIPTILAAVFVALFYPLYGWLLKLFRNNKSLSSLVCCFILLLGLITPVSIVANLVSGEAISLYQTVEQKVQEIIQKGDERVLKNIKEYKWVKKLHLNEIDWQSSLQESAQAGAKLLATVINKASKGTFQVLANLFLTFFAMFYFFRDGDKLIQRLKYLSPLADKYKEELFIRFISVSRATIKGTVVVGLIKGFIGGLTFWIFGISSPILWGVVMAILSIIPMLGAWLVMYPAAVIFLLLGHIWQGIALFLISTLIISSVDNILQPRLVGRSTGLHDLLIFFSTLGGIGMFGVMGFIVGPIIAALFISILDVYSIEFKSQLDLAQG